MVRGGGDLGSGVALRLWRVGFAVVVFETLRPLAVRLTVSFAEAVYAGRTRVEEALGTLTGSPSDALAALGRCEVAVLVDPAAAAVGRFAPVALVDAVMAKRHTGTRLDMAPCVVALGPGFRAGQDAHAVVETNRGPNLGRVIWEGEAESDTGEPAPVVGRSGSRVLRSPATGTLHTIRAIGDIVEEGETVAAVAGRPVLAPFQGLVRGLAHSGLEVRTGTKIGDVDPRLDPDLCLKVSDKALAVAGGALEAILMMRKSRYE